MKGQKTIQRHWSKKDILHEISLLERVTAKFCQKNNPNLYGAAVRHFGSWKKAVEVAGFDYKQVLKRKPPGYWSKDRVVSEIKKLSYKNSGAVRKNNPGLYSATLRVFTSWKIALESIEGNN